MADFKLGALVFDLIADKDGKFASVLTKAKNQALSSAESMRKAFSGVNGLIAAIGIGAAMNEGIKAMEESEKAVGSLEAALARTGEASRKTVEDLTAYSTALMNLTVYDDEAITSAMAFGKSLGMPTAFLKQAAEAAIGLSTRLGVDLNTSMKLLQRASAGNVTALQRLGVSFEGAKTPVEKLDAVLKFAKSGFDQAQAYAQTAAGRMQQFKNQLGEASETLGKALIPWINLLIKTALPILITLLDRISPAMLGGAIAAAGLIYVFMNLSGWVKALKDGYVVLTTAIVAAKTALGDKTTLIAVSTAVAAVVGLFVYMGIQADKAMSDVKESFNNIGPTIENVQKQNELLNKSFVASQDIMSRSTNSPDNPLVKQAEELRNIIDQTKEATRAEMERRSAMIGTIEIQDINRKASEAGLRERWSMVIKNQGDVVANMQRGDVSRIRLGIPTRTQFEQAYMKQQQEKNLGQATLQQIYMLLQDRLWSNRDLQSGFGAL